MKRAKRGEENGHPGEQVAINMDRSGSSCQKRVIRHDSMVNKLDMVEKSYERSGATNKTMERKWRQMAQKPLEPDPAKNYYLPKTSFVY